MYKKQLTERDICTKCVTPAIERAGWRQSQFREEVKLTDGRVMVRGRLAARVTNPEARGGPKRADYVLYTRPNLPIAVIEVKRNTFSMGHGMQQALAYAEMLDAPFALSTNGDGFLIHDRTSLTQPIERELAMDRLPGLEELWPLYQQWKGLDTAEWIDLVEQPYHTDGSGKKPRYYQRVAINRAIEAVAKGQNRILLVMATGTGKTYTAFQIIWRLWKAKRKKRVLFLPDRNILIDQTIQQDFAPFGEVMHKIANREVKKNYEIYLSLYQAVTGNSEWKQIYRQFPSDFFDLVVVDECHRGSADEDSAWREVLDYFTTATHLGLTATPKETKQISTQTYFGEPLYIYSLKQGIEDGFLAPYKVIRIVSDVDALGYTPEAGKTDKYGQPVEPRQYNTKDYDRKLVLEQRTQLVAARTWEYLKNTDPMRDGYWWLAFDYTNFRLCGNVGNRKKGGWFPLRTGTRCSAYTDPCEESESPYLLDPTDPDDVTLIAFDEEGNAIPAPGISDWESLRVNETIKRLKLNEHEALAEGQRKIWQTVSREIELYLAAKSRCATGSNPAAKQKVNEHLRHIRSMTRKDAELSSVARWCLLFRNDSQLSKLAA